MIPTNQQIDLINKAFDPSTLMRDCPNCKRSFIIEGDIRQMLNAKHINFKGICCECDGLEIVHNCSTMTCNDCETTLDYPVVVGIDFDSIDVCRICGSPNITKNRLEEDTVIIRKVNKVNLV